MDAVIPPVRGSRTRTRMELRTSAYCGPMLAVTLLVAATLVSMVTSSSPAAGVLDFNRTGESPLPPSPPPPNPPSDSGYRGNSGGSSAEASDPGAQGIHLLLRPPDLLSPSLPPPLPPHAQPTLTPPPPSLEEAWGSGDYLETLSFEELALATPLPSNPYDDNDGDWVSYDTAFPARPTLPLSSRLALSPSSPSVTPSIPLHTSPAHPDVFPTWDEDYDLEDLTPLQPTELLLPDMNSMEYYTNLLQRERERERERERVFQTDSKPRITPTTTLPPSGRDPVRPPEGPTPPLTLSPSLPPPPLPTIRTAPIPRDAAPAPGRPPPRPVPSNTTGWVPPPPPLGPPTRPDRPERPSGKAPPPTTQIPPISLTRAPAQAPPPRLYLCNATKPEMYLVRVVSSKSSPAGFTTVRELLKREFNRSVELQFLRTPSSFAFRVVSGPLIFTAISVINALRQAPRAVGPVPAVAVLYIVPDRRYHIHSVLQFVPAHVDVRVCNFSERIERGLMMAYAETQRRAHEAGNASVQLLNITMSAPRPPAVVPEQKVSVDITFAVRDGRDFLPGSEVSEHLRKLSLVEFSFYVGFPALQIAEPFHYPELNTTHHLRYTWVRTVLLGVEDQLVSGRSFKARLERRLALLLEEGLQAASRGRWRRATAAGNNSLQVVRVARLSGVQRPLEVLYFVEGPGGERVPAEETARALNRLELQRAAIVLGHRVQRPIAQPVETLSVPPAETQSGSVWLVVGVVVPVLLAVFIIIILYVKLCVSEKLEFQPDAISTIQQRQKLQAPSVKGFDFAKLHLGQHSKDDIMVIQEPGPAPAKEATPPDAAAADLNTPKSKGSSTKAPRSGRRHRGRLSPSDADSLGSDQSSGRESAEESTRPVATPSEGKHRKTPRNGRNKMGSGADELLSSSSIFDHVDRLSRASSDGTRRHANKVQLIAMEPRPSPPRLHGPPHLSPTLTEKVSTEVALRHKSEIEHHRNKLRQRAKRRGQCEFPSMDDIMDAFGDGPVQSEVAQRLYSSAHDHMDCILQADGHAPPTPSDSRRRGRRSPRGRRAPPGPGSLPDTDRDRLLTDHSATYRKYPGLNNVAYMSDPDLPQAPGSPSPTDEVFDSPPAPPPYLPPQPSIEEARQQMHSLLDDAFALVSPSSQGSAAGLSGVSPALPSPSPPPRPPGYYPAAPAHSPFSARYAELGMSPASIQGLLQRPGLGSGGFVSTGEPLQDSVYSSRGQYEDPPSSSRPRPVGGSTGAQLHHLTQVGLSSQIAAFPGVGRSVSGPTGSSWNQQHSDQDLSRPGASRESVLSFPEFSSSVFQMPGSSLRDAPPLLMTSPPPEYPPEDASPSAHTSASLIKAIREELRRLAQKQGAVTSYP
ncbi:LOW QUALITY PROTEIN: UPF0606 protein KIAA1549 [Sander vitreus]